MLDLINGVSTAIDIAKKLKQSADAIKDSETKLLIADLMGQLADVKIRCSELIEENSKKMQRKMSDPAFQKDQWRRRFAPHVAPVNKLVDALRRERGEQIPYVAPLYGGIDAEALFILQDPGPGTDDSGRGSGFICTQNDDPTAELFADCLDACKLDVCRILGWNAYPWQLPEGQKRPKANQLEAGVEPTRRLLELLPKLKSIVLMGRVAEDGWNRLIRRHPELAKRYNVVPSPHPSRRGLVGGGMTREEGIGKVKQAMRTACKIGEP